MDDDLKKAADYINAAPNPAERQRRKAEQYHKLYGSPTGRLSVSEPNRQEIPKKKSPEALAIIAAIKGLKP